MEINRFKLLILLIIIGPVAWIAWEQSLEFVNNFNYPQNKVKVVGAMNSASSFAGFFIVTSIMLLGLIPLVTGKKANWIPKIVFSFIGIVSIILFFSGWAMNISLKDKLIDSGYIECTSARKITLKYSSRTYVLPPATCD